MSTRMKSSVLPVALLMMGTLAMTQSQTLAAQGSSSPANSTAGQGKENPQDRLTDAVQSGPVRAGEPANLESAGQATYMETMVDRSANGGMLATPGINKSIDDLSRAFAGRDFGAVKQLWPSISDKSFSALEKSFVYFKSVSRNFRPENIDVNGDVATVVGSYSGSFVKGKTTIPSNGTFHATLKKVGTRWIVASLVCS
jgi:hypothetical protein